MSTSTPRYQFKYSMQSSRTALIGSFFVFTSISGFCLLSLIEQRNPVILIPLLMVMPGVVLRGIGIFVAFFRSPLRLIYDEGILIASMFLRGERRYSLNSVTSIRKSRFKAACSYYSIEMSFSDGESIVLHDDAEMNNRMNEFLDSVGLTIRIEPRHAEEMTKSPISTVPGRTTWGTALGLWATILSAVGVACFVVGSLSLTYTKRTSSKEILEFAGSVLLIFAFALFTIAFSRWRTRIIESKEKQGTSRKEEG